MNVVQIMCRIFGHQWTERDDPDSEPPVYVTEIAGEPYYRLPSFFKDCTRCGVSERWLLNSPPMIAYKDGEGTCISWSVETHTQ